MTFVNVMLAVNFLACIGLTIALAKIATLMEDFIKKYSEVQGVDIILGQATWEAVQDIQQKVDDLHQAFADGPFEGDDDDVDGEHAAHAAELRN